MKRRLLSWSMNFICIPIFKAFVIVPAHRRAAIATRKEKDRLNAAINTGNTREILRTSITWSNAVQKHFESLPNKLLL